MEDNFSAQAALYAKYRPVYPKDLFDYICSFVHEKNLACDCATGNGQTARELSKYFERVYATDISSRQIENAVKTVNITYAVEPAEKISLHDGVVDLTTVSQALHWLDHGRFYDEVKRVSKRGAIIAAWTYNLLQADPVTDKIIHHYHFNTLDKYWTKERVYVDTGYDTIPFPFTQIKTPQFSIEVNWNLAQLEGYLNTWSALQKFIIANNFNPVERVIEAIKKNWSPGESRRIVFPLSLKIGYVTPA